MLPKKWLERATQEELYEAFQQISNYIEDSTLAQFAGETAAVVPFSNYSEQAYELMAEPNKMHGVLTGYSDIDDLTRGFEPGELVIVGAVEGVGKSMLVQNLFHNMGSRGTKNLFISMEMPNQEAMKRYIEMEMGTGKKKEAAQKSVEAMPMFAYDADNMNLDQLDEKIGEAIKNDGIEIVGIDHLHYFAPQSSEGNSSAAIGYLVRKLKLMARKHNIPFIVISHLRKLKKKGMPDKNDLRDSSFIAQDADCVIMLDRDWMNDDDVIRLTLKWEIQKNRTRGFLGRGELYIGKTYKITEVQ